jgi:hypothetical protein
MSEALRKAAEQGLDALEDLRVFGVKQSAALFALRDVLEVSAVGVKSNGEVLNTGVKTSTPPRMRAKELVNKLYGSTWEEDDGSDADLCFAVCEQLLEWLIAQGWSAAPPVQTPPPPHLTEQDIVRLKQQIRGTLDVQFPVFARVIETAVRKQFGVTD